MLIYSQTPKRGNFDVEMISEENEDTKATGTATLNGDGTITWNVSGINASETATFKNIKLKLNKNQTIATYSLYNDIKTNSETVINYTKEGEEKTLKGEETRTNNKNM